MAFWEHLPYTNFHEINLSWVLEKVKDLENTVGNFTITNSFKIGGMWNITRQYEKFTIVTTENRAYISTQPVPAGVAIENENYWVEIGDLDPRIASLEQHVAKLDKRRIVNVVEFGADPTGLTDSYPAFMEAISKTVVGEPIFIPQGSYMLSEIIPDVPRVWLADTGTVYSGVGAGDPTLWQGEFSSPLTNRGNRNSGIRAIYDLTKIPCPRFNAVSAESQELTEDVGLDTINVIGSIYHGSYTLNLQSVANIDKGDAILIDGIAMWPVGDTPNNCMRVYAVDKDSNSVTICKTDSAENEAPTPWEGENIINGLFRIRKRKWYLITYQGLSTGKVDNVDKVFYIYNSTAQVTGAAAVNMELDLNMVGNPKLDSIGLLMQGSGRGDGKCIAISVNREHRPWDIGVAIKQALYGLYINAKNPALIETNFYNAKDDSTTPISAGITFDNFIDAGGTLRPLFIGGLLDGGSNGIVIRRYSENGDTGNFLLFTNSNATETLSKIDANGNALFHSVATEAFRFDGGVVAGPYNQDAGYIPVEIPGVGTRYIKLYG